MGQTATNARDSASATAAKRQCAERIIVVFRNDDPSAISNLQHEREVFAMFERHGVPQTLAVVPKIALTDLHDPAGKGEKSLAENAEMVEFLKSYAARSGSEIALHGFTHRTNRYSIPGRREYFEFRELGLEEQEQMIAEGTEILAKAFGARPTTFVPPWNRLDQNTLSACARQGYKVVSAGPYLDSGQDLLSFGTNTDFHGFDAAYRQLKEAPGRVFIHVLFHSNTLTDHQKQLLASILQTISQDPECQVMTSGEAAARFPEGIRKYNKAGENFVPPYQAPGSPRSRAWPYLAALEKISPNSAISTLLSRAKELYQKGDYESCAALNAAITQKCRSVLWLGRAFALASGLLFSLALSFLAGPTQRWLPGLSIIVIFGGFFCARRATAPDTRREIRAAAAFAAFGVLAAALIGWAARVRT